MNPKSDSLKRLHFLIHGRVQGVGYRWFVREKARELDLGGWVCNRPDGTVEAEAEGAAKTLAAFTELLRSGHPYAQVEKINTSDKRAAGDGKEFEIL